MNLKDRIINFEQWISSDFKLEEPKIFQRELLKLFLENKDAYSYYRNWLFNLTLSTDEQIAIAEFKNILDLKAGTSKHRQLLEHFVENNSSEVFAQKRINTFEIALQAPNSNLNQSTCFLYQQYYEIEILFLILYSFITLNESHKVDTDVNNFRDRSGKLRKGVLIDHLKSKLRPYPIIHNLFEKAYKAKIRNTIGHNNYKIVGDQIDSLEDQNISVTKDEIFQAIYAMQSLNNYLANYFSYKSIPIGDLHNAGILGVSFGLEAGRPVLSIFQLSCFYDLHDSKWAKKIHFSIGNDELVTNIGSQTLMIGPYSKEMGEIWFNPLADEKQLRVYLTPIVPRNDETNFITLDVGEFVVTERGRSKDLDYDISK